MALFLVQHGKSLPKEEDPEKGLSQEGMAEVERIAAEANRHGVVVVSIAHSGKRRAEQTAKLLAAALQPPGGVEQRDGLKPMDDVAEVAKGLSAADNLMLVGHLPFMERLTSYLVAGFSDRPLLKFQNGGIVCLDQDQESGTWFIRWTLVPKVES